MTQIWARVESKNGSAKRARVRAKLQSATTGTLLEYIRAGCVAKVRKSAERVTGAIRDTAELLDASRFGSRGSTQHMPRVLSKVIDGVDVCVKCQTLARGVVAYSHVT